MCTQKIRALSYIGAKKITFPPKPDIQTDIHTYRRTDISVYRGALLLITCTITIKLIYIINRPIITFTSIFEPGR